MKEKILKYLEEIKNLRFTPDNTIQKNTYYLNDKDILCTESDYGDVRYPYEMDGMNLWIHANGYIDACESRLTILRTAFFQDEPCIDFWGGIKLDEQEWCPISILGINKAIYERTPVKRYTIFAKRAAYYIADSAKITFAVRANITTKKQLSFTVCAINKTNEEAEIYFASYMDFLLRYQNNEGFWGLMSRYGKLHQNGSFDLYTSQDVNYHAVINKTIQCNDIYDLQSTVSKCTFTGGPGNCVHNAKSLVKGYFERKIYSANTANYPIVSDIIKTKLTGGEYACVGYIVNIVSDDEIAKRALSNDVDLDAINADILKQENDENANLSGLSANFSGIDIKSINSKVFNRFLKNVQKQVDLCALGKNYVGAFMGMRDVFQQLDTSLMWNPEASRKKIISALNHIMINGRTPRQYSIPPKEDMIPEFDLREYIDQGIWVIETLYNYLAFTNDYSILDERCHYYEIIDVEKREYKRCEKETVLDHLLRITDYLVSNIASDTGCLRVLFGDWNDALNGMGRSKENDVLYGTGVSVMASAQLYRNLEEISQILKHKEGFEDKLAKYKNVRENLAQSLYKYAVQFTENSGYHIIHGWGDKKSYDVGSLCDTDGKCRYSSTAYSFWCISGLIEKAPELKSDILKAFKILDSKYGIKTFEPYFERNAEGVGSIRDITHGTYENSCSYIHATMFATMALFILGEGKMAWEQIEKAIPITHDRMTKTPFVMPNSYCHNEEYCMDGESMGDWYTGSGAVLVRNIVKFALGVFPDLDGVKIQPSKYMPSSNINLQINVKGHQLIVLYKNEGTKKARSFLVNGKEQKFNLDVVSGVPYIYIKNEDIKDNLKVEVID